MTSAVIAPDAFRHVFGHFCTGVTVITTSDAEGPAGFACQAFAALSLEPPLVVFCPSRTSVTWQRIAGVRTFCANVLSEGQREVARTFGRPNAGKFDGLGWEPASNGAPVLDGVLTWAACTVRDVYEAGDHYLVTGEVTELGPCASGQPLLFFRGRYGVPGPVAGPPEVVDTLLSWSRHTDWI
jgi:3-hydroxy-9,10-secoandrosta-1,3,5(10)-triene-9,17-dione monooxygenase reductase component